MMILLKGLFKQLKSAMIENPHNIIKVIFEGKKQKADKAPV